MRNVNPVSRIFILESKNGGFHQPVVVAANPACNQQSTLNENHQ